MTRRITLLLVLFAACAMAFQWTNQKKSKPRDTSVRNVEGVVQQPDGSAAPRAVVQLKNMKNLQIRSYIANEEGKYQFQGLSMSVDYELTASYNEMASPKRSLSVFDTRLDAVINLKLEAKKDSKAEDKK
ncbi:MAG: carboxypeptidase regulatory-like domain-containing protein [Acidobacteria bacterium]|nr:carboxypeptidase regulatory-like domain-containing protein [Acidobacteriota bacterium]